MPVDPFRIKVTTQKYQYGNNQYNSHFGLPHVGLVGNGQYIIPHYDSVSTSVVRLTADLYVSLLVFGKYRILLSNS